MKREKEATKDGCTHHRSDHQHHDRSPGYRGDLFRDHRPRVSRYARKVRAQARARVGQLGAARRAVVVALIAITTALGLAFIPTAAQAATSLTPPSSTDALVGSSLPQCADVAGPGSAVGPNTNAATQLGWGPGKPSMLVYPGSYAVQMSPVIPCQDSDYLTVYIHWNVISGTPDAYRALAIFVLGLTCVDSAGVQSVFTRTDTVALNYTNEGVYTGAYSSQRLSACGRIVKVTMSLCSGSSSCNNITPPMNAVWVPRQWNTADSGFTPATSVGQVLGAGTELPIICRIDNSGADIVAVTQNVVASIVNWFPCMFIPVGWDRAGMIPTAWTTGPVGQLTAAYKQAVPSGISCGQVGTISFFSRTISLDTCQADFAPGFVKTVVGYVLILGVCLLIVRRIMWSVGSKA